MLTGIHWERMTDAVTERLLRIPSHVRNLILDRLNGTPEETWRIRTIVDVCNDGTLDRDSIRWNIEITTHPEEWVAIGQVDAVILGLSDAEINEQMLEAEVARIVNAKGPDRRP
jgi:hypothetical protein